MLMLQDALSQLGKGVRQLSDLAALDQISLIVIDQFEELFTQAEAKPRDEFVALLEALPPFDQIHAHFIATLRSDYLKELSEVKPLWDVVTQGIVLRAMSEDSLHKAILKPPSEIS
jgi:superfamily II DNA/RNA helicase